MIAYNAVSIFTIILDKKFVMFDIVCSEIANFGHAGSNIVMLTPRPYATVSEIGLGLLLYSSTQCSPTLALNGHTRFYGVVLPVLEHLVHNTEQNFGNFCSST